MDLKKNVQSSFFALLPPFFLFFSFFLFFLFLLLLLPRNDTMPVNPYRTFPVWQQAVSPPFTFVLKTAGLGMRRLNFTLRRAPLVKSAR